MGAIRNLINRYVHNRDIDERVERTMRVRLSITEKAARNLHRVAEATGDADAERRSQEASQEAARMRRQLESHYDMYARGSR